MVPSLARQAVIIKCGNDTSILTGNYELAYALGFLAKQGEFSLSAEEADLKKMQETVVQEWESRTPEDERTRQLIRMVKRYNPTKEFDRQMKELLQMGLTEEYPWDVHR